MQTQMNMQQEIILKHTADQNRALVSALKDPSRRRPPTLPPIRGDRHLLNDLTRFEQQMVAHHVEKEQWPAELLKDEALSAFLAMPPVDASDYDMVNQL